ncbi:hypothetical protein L6164_030501 [Bauhinia variegata]|uniref:Uncharacterized protein n=1 Tax=Bauhinia variegata TaxID=167791 RepID=A0ACB9LCU6_BAUVA|nr:hypothetical protein L6164_030501 [Bauhinia variegata]
MIFSATNRLITSKDHASVQINVGHLDENGIYNGHFSTFDLLRLYSCSVETCYGLYIFLKFDSPNSASTYILVYAI